MFRKLYEECIAVITNSERCRMINLISEAWCDELITDEENDMLVDLLK